MRRLISTAGMVVLLLATGVSVHGRRAAAPDPRTNQRSAEPSAAVLRRLVTFGGVERDYFVRLPQRFDATRTYWLVVAAHGAGGNGRNFFLASGIRRVADEQGLDAIVVSPTFSGSDGAAQQFPSLGEGALLDAIVADVGRQYSVHPKILLAGYSRGGQFSHRYCQQSPSRVAACAPFAAGSWTTPDGHVLIQGVGDLADVAAARTRAEPLVGELTEPRIAAVAWSKAAAGAKAVPFLIMTGTLDPRNQVGRLFVESLKRNGFSVESVWPITDHSLADAAPAESAKYAIEAVSFFKKAATSVQQREHDR